MKTNRSCKRTFRFFLTCLRPRNSKLRYGLFLITSCIIRIRNKQKSYSFNNIIRLKNKLDCLEGFMNSLGIYYRSQLSSSFQSLRTFSIGKLNRNIISFALMVQGFQEKIKYRQVIRGFNSFKSLLLSKSLGLDMVSESSFKKHYGFVITPPSFSPAPSQ